MVFGSGPTYALRKDAFRRVCYARTERAMRASSPPLALVFAGQGISSAGSVVEASRTLWSSSSLHFCNFFSAISSAVLDGSITLPFGLSEAFVKPTTLVSATVSAVDETSELSATDLTTAGGRWVGEDGHSMGGVT